MVSIFETDTIWLTLIPAIMSLAVAVLNMTGKLKFSRDEKKSDFQKSTNINIVELQKSILTINAMLSKNVECIGRVEKTQTSVITSVNELAKTLVTIAAELKSLKEFHDLKHDNDDKRLEKVHELDKRLAMIEHSFKYFKTPVQFYDKSLSQEDIDQMFQDDKAREEIVEDDDDQGQD